MVPFNHPVPFLPTRNPPERQSPHPSLPQLPPSKAWNLSSDSSLGHCSTNVEWELVRRGWSGLKHSDLPVVRIIGWSGVMVLLFVLVAVAALSEDRMPKLLPLLAATEIARITILRDQPRLKVGYFDTKNRIGAWFERRFEKPEITCSSASIGLVFMYFVIPPIEIMNTVGMFAIMLSVAGLLVGSRRQQLSEYTEILRTNSWRWRYYDRASGGPTFGSFVASAIVHGFLGLLGSVFWRRLAAGLGGVNSEHPALTIDDVVAIAITIAIYRFMLLAVWSKTSIGSATTKRLIAVRTESPIGWTRSARRSVLIIVPLLISCLITAAVAGSNGMSNDEAMSILPAVALLLYGIASLVPMVHPGARNVFDILSGTMPVSEESWIRLTSGESCPVDRTGGPEASAPVGES